MRTKALLGLAALAVSIATVSAQNVYSLNVVGYYNLTMKPGYNLVANQLNSSNNTLNAVLPAAPLESLVLTYANNNYITDISDGTAWLDNSTGNPSTTTVKPGQGFFYFNPATADRVVTFVGEVVQGNGLSVTNKPGYNLVSSIVPQAIELTAANGFPQVLEMLYMTYSNPPGGYTTLINDGSAWLDNVTGAPAQAIPQVGQGFFVFNPASTDHVWTRNFTVQ